METFKEYCTRKDEGVGQFIKGVFNSDYRDLPPKLKSYYDMLTPQAKAEVDQLRQALQIPLIRALKQYMSETGARDKWKQYQQQVPSERDPGKVIPWGQDHPGWKRF